MLINASTLAEGSVLHADVCIVGSGPAGITVARALEGIGLAVLLMEAGAEDLDADVQETYAGEGEGFASDNYLTQTRARYFGGTSNLWAGWSRPLEPEDFEIRPWVPYSGWPIAYEDVAAFHPQADTVLDLDAVLEADAWNQSSRPPFPLDATRVEHRMWRFAGRLRFGERYGSALVDSTDIRVVLNANLTGLHGTPTVTGATFHTHEGTSFRVEATHFVLACGGIENARLLLAFELGTESTGRFFMEHPHVSRMVDITTSAATVSLYSDRTADEISDTRTTALLALPGSRQADEGLLNLAMMLLDVGETELDALGESIAAFRTEQTGLPTETGTLRGMCEQAPNPDSRITLVNSTDRFGMRRVRLDWQMTELDWTSAVRTTELLADALAEAGVARSRMDVRADTPWPRISGGHHHMGTTRMASTADEGVVDTNCRVFGTDNLYVAGSSVFPTGGAANPTLTIVALAERLAEHLREQL